MLEQEDTREESGSSGIGVNTFETPSIQDSYQSGSSISKSDLEDSLRSIFSDAKNQFREDIDTARSTLNESDSERFDDLRDRARQVFDDGKEEFKEIKRNARDSFQSGAFSEEDLSSFTGQAQSLFGDVRREVLDLFSGNRSSQSESADSEPSFESSEEDEQRNHSSNSSNTLDPAQLENSRGILETETNLGERLGEDGDVLDPGGGVNVAVGAGGNDIFLGNRDGAFNTFATGNGNDLVVLGESATNRIFDFNPAEDTFGLTDDLSFDNIIFGQGTNPDKGGIDQPLDSENNTVIIDKVTQQILASLSFVDAGSLSVNNFVRLDTDELEGLVRESLSAT